MFFRFGSCFRVPLEVLYDFNGNYIVVCFFLTGIFHEITRSQFLGSHVSSFFAGKSRVGPLSMSPPPAGKDNDG